LESESQRVGETDSDCESLTDLKSTISMILIVDFKSVTHSLSVSVRYTVSRWHHNSQSRVHFDFHF